MIIQVIHYIPMSLDETNDAIEAMATLIVLKVKKKGRHSRKNKSGRIEVPERGILLKYLSTTEAETRMKEYRSRIGRESKRKVFDEDGREIIEVYRIFEEN